MQQTAIEKKDGAVKNLGPSRTLSPPRIQGQLGWGGEVLKKANPSHEVAGSIDTSFPFQGSPLSLGFGFLCRFGCTGTENGHLCRLRTRQGT